MRVILAFGLIVAGAMSASAQTTLYVNGSTGNDAVSKADNSASTPWRTIGRAVWGSTNRSSPNSSEAAAAGDTVQVAGGTYSTSVTVNSRWTSVYNPVNSGTASAYITITCVGECVLAAPNANSPVIGAQAKNYVKWYADVNASHAWRIQAYGSQGGSAGSNQVNTTPDTGPVVCNGSTGCWIEGVVIDGGSPVDFEDNWNGIRIENVVSPTIRNNVIRNFRTAGGSGNATGITMYGTSNGVLEHNEISNTQSGFYLKDTGTTLPQNSNRIRLNRLTGVGSCFRFSVTGENRNYIYQNVCANSSTGLSVVGGGLFNDWIGNNTFYNLTMTGVWPSPNGTGGRFWNNIVAGSDRAVLIESGPMPGEAVIDLEHNVYYSNRQFYWGTDGSRTFSGFTGAYPGHDRATPASVEANPLFVNASGGDFRLCTGAGAPASSCSGASPAIDRAVDIFDVDGDGNTSETIRGGAYVNNSEVIGLEGGLPRAPTNLRITSGQ